MAMSRTTWGFDEAIKRLHDMPRLMNENMKRATLHNATNTRDAIKKTIQRGRPEWDSNSPLTRSVKGSSKALVDHGDLMNSVGYKVVSPFVFFIGVPRTAKHSSGAKMVNIAAVQEYGATIRPKKAKILAIPVTREAQRLSRQHRGVRNIPGLFRPGNKKILARAGSKGGFEVLFILKEQVVIPPRPFIQTTFQDEQSAISRRWQKGASDALKGRRYVAG